MHSYILIIPKREREGTDKNKDDRVSPASQVARRLSDYVNDEPCTVD